MAMASRFELILEGEHEPWMRAAGEEALSEIERLDRQLTIFSPASEVSRINARAAREAVPVEPRLFELLRLCKKLHEDTAGAFDVSVAPLMRAWGFYRGGGKLPTSEALNRAREVTGMHLVHLDAGRRTVSFERDGVLLDFGAIGKGYAIDEAIAILREAGVERAFLHGGTSTAYGIGTSEDGRPWQVALPYPGEHATPVDVSPAIPDPAAATPSSEAPAGRRRESAQDRPATERKRDDTVDPAPGNASLLAVAPLENMSLSVSAVWGEAFEADGKTLGHVLDPRRGRPVDGAVMTAVAAGSATEADALSTALLVLGRDGGALVERLRGRARVLLLFSAENDHMFDVIESDFPTIPSHRHHVGTLPT